MPSRSLVMAAGLALAIYTAGYAAGNTDEPQDGADVISLHKPYFLLPSPSYWGCTDPGDVTQLTDGQRSRGDWLDPLCVGWSEGGSDVAVLIDLQTPRQFDQLRLSTLRGRFANVLPPLHVAIYVSDEGKVFEHVIEAETEDLRQVHVATHEREPGNVVEHLLLDLDGFSARGRYVLVAMKRGHFLFLDEVSLFHRGGESASSPEPMSHRRPSLTSAEVISQYLGVPVVFNRDIPAHVTPHWPLARPLAGGAIDLMAIIPVSTSRDLEELAQRLDVAMHAIATDEGPQTPMNGLLQVQIADRLRSHRPQVLLMAGTRWDWLTPPLREQIVARVREGMGLVIVDPRMKLDELREAGLPLAANVSADADRLRERGPIIPMAHGAGRVALIDNRGRSNPALHTLIAPPGEPRGRMSGPPVWDHEYDYSRVAAAVHWAALREGVPPTAAIADLRDEPSRLTVTTAGNTEPIAIRLTVRDAFGHTVHEATTVTTENAAGFTLPTLPGTTLHALIQVLNAQDQVQDWRLINLKQSPAASITRLSVPRSIDGSAGDIPVQLQWSASAGDAAVVPDTVRFILTDNHGRVVADVTHPLPAGGQFAHALHHPSLISRAVTLRAMLLHDGRLLDQARQTLLVRRPAGFAEHFRVDFWTGANQMAYRHYAPAIYALTRQLGADGIFSTWPMDELCNLAAMHDLSVIPENILRIVEADTSTATERVPTLGSDAFNAQLAERVTAALDKYLPYGVELVSLGDECRYASGPDTDRSPEALRLFRQWLRERFGTIDALNQAMGSNYRGYDDLVPPLTAEARAQHDLPLWLAHRQFTLHQFNDAIGVARQIWRQRDPDAPFGISGAQLPSVSNGHDYAALAAENDAISVYRALQRELLRSFAKPGHHHTLWSGFDYSTRNERLEKYFVWLAAFEGFRGIALFNQFEQTAHPMYSTGYIGPDLRPHQRALWMAQAARQVRDAGVSQLIAAAQPADRSVAVVYSTRSMFLHHVCGIANADYTDQATLYLDAVGGTVKALQDLQWPFHLLDESQLDQLDPTVTRLVLMPATVSVADEALTGLRRYAEEGGHVVLGLNVGRYDAYGNARTAQQVEATLGIAPVFIDDVTPARALVGQRVLSGRGSITNLSGCLFDYEPTVVGGVGGELVETGGTSQRQAQLRDMFDQVIVATGLQRKARVTAESGQRAHQVEVFPFTAGQGYRFVAVLGNYSQAGVMTDAQRMALTLELNRTGHVYELVTGTHFGLTGSAAMRLEQGEGRFFAVLPRPVVAIHGDVATHGNRVQVDAAVTLAQDVTPGPHVLRFVVTDAAGRVRPEYGATLLTQAGKVTHAFDTALNDPDGTWHVQITDTISQRAMEISCDLSRPNPGS